MFGKGGAWAYSTCHDRPTSTALLDEDLLANWSCDFTTTLARAVANLVERSPVAFEPMEGGFYRAAYNDTYDSSRLLLPELFRGLPVKGAPVAVAVSRTCLLVAGSKDVKGLTAMAAHARAAYDDETRPTSCMPLVLDGGVWRKFEPDAPSLGAVRDLALYADLSDYGAQTPELERFFAVQGIEGFVAPLEGVWMDGRLRTWTTWTRDASAHLPRAEIIAMIDRSGRRLIRSWADVELTCGPFQADTRLHPHRFRADWPDADAWRRLETQCAPPSDWQDLELA